MHMQTKKCFKCTTIISPNTVIREKEINNQHYLFCSQRCELSFLEEQSSMNSKYQNPKQTSPIPIENSHPVHRYLQESATLNGSDLFLSAGEPPRLRLGADFKVLESTCLTDDILMSFLQMTLTPKKLDEFYSGLDVDIALETPDKTRYRLNIFRHYKGIGIVVRMLPNKIRSFNELGLPQAFEKLIYSTEGLILVTGATGSGKTATLASFINTINNQFERHIITIEDPIEYVIPNKKSMIHQREVGRHVGSFADGLKSALRESPDVIVVGEMRDLESITWALRAAETGHLVLGTLHSSTASQTITRLIDVFDTSRQQQIRIQLAESLLCVCSQKLIPKKDKQEMVLATEVLINTLAISNLIRMNNTHSIAGYIKTGAEYHMHSFEQCIANLAESGLIDITRVA